MARERDDPSLSRHAKLREVETHVVGQMCHVLWSWTTGDACGPNMMTRNSYALNMGYVMEQRAGQAASAAILEANMGGDKKPSHRYFERGGHGKTVIAEVTLTEAAVRRNLRTTPEDLGALAFAGHARRDRLGHAVLRLHAGHHRRRALHRDRPGHRHGRDELDGARDGRGRRRRLPLLDPHARHRGRHGRRRHDAPLRALLARRSWAAPAPGKVHRFAQIVAAATLALEISRVAAMATAGSENFFQAHHERGGLR